MIFGLRPEDIYPRAASDVAESAGNVGKAEVEVVEPLGSDAYLFVTAGEFELVARVSGRTLVHPGDTVKTEDPLITLESDKASMDVPSPLDGVVKELKVKVGDKVSEGSLILLARTALSSKESRRVPSFSV